MFLYPVPSGIMGYDELNSKGESRTEHSLAGYGFFSFIAHIGSVQLNDDGFQTFARWHRLHLGATAQKEWTEV